MVESRLVVALSSYIFAYIQSDMQIVCSNSVVRIGIAIAFRLKFPTLCGTPPLFTCVWWWGWWLGGVQASVRLLSHQRSRPPQSYTHYTCPSQTVVMGTTIVSPLTMREVPLEAKRALYYGTVSNCKDYSPGVPRDKFRQHPLIVCSNPLPPNKHTLPCTLMYLCTPP